MQESVQGALWGESKPPGGMAEMTATPRMSRGGCLERLLRAWRSLLWPCVLAEPHTCRVIFLLGGLSIWCFYQNPYPEPSGWYIWVISLLGGLSILFSIKIITQSLLGNIPEWYPYWEASLYCFSIKILTQSLLDDISEWYPYWEASSKILTQSLLNDIYEWYPYWEASLYSFSIKILTQSLLNDISEWYPYWEASLSLSLSLAFSLPACPPACPKWPDLDTSKHPRAEDFSKVANVTGNLLLLILFLYFPL